jgi:hypothetical protein
MHTGTCPRQGSTTASSAGRRAGRCTHGAVSEAFVSKNTVRESSKSENLVKPLPLFTTVTRVFHWKQGRFDVGCRSDAMSRRIGVHRGLSCDRGTLKSMQKGGDSEDVFQSRDGPAGTAWASTQCAGHSSTGPGSTPGGGYTMLLN